MARSTTEPPSFLTLSGIQMQAARHQPLEFHRSPTVTAGRKLSVNELRGTCQGHGRPPRTNGGRKPKTSVGPSEMLQMLELLEPTRYQHHNTTLYRRPPNHLLHRRQPTCIYKNSWGRHCHPQVMLELIEQNSRSSSTNGSGDKPCPSQRSCLSHDIGRTRSR